MISVMALPTVLFCSVLVICALRKDGGGSVAQNRESAPKGEVDGRLHPLPATVAR